MGDCACDVAVGQLDPSTRLSHFFLELTPDCSQACPGCGSVHAGYTKPPPLPAAGWRSIVDRLLPLHPSLRLTGGEPTLHPEFEAILAYLDDCQVPFTLFTNARWTDPDTVLDTLAGNFYLKGVLVSIHGAGATSHEAFTATPGSFDQVVRNASRASQASLEVCTSTVITHHNYGEMQDIVELTRAIGAQRATFSRYIGPSLPQIEASESELDLAVQAIEGLLDNGHRAMGGAESIRYGAPIPHCFTPNRSNGCMAGFVHATIDPWGNLRPCPHVPLIAGNLLEQDLEGIWHSEAMDNWRAGLLAQCDGCDLVHECRSGCQAQAFWRKAARDPLILI
jgi:radical SAM protein with 4Fe4S-binding SPASM domain